ncbi:hypothetical protein OKA06_20170 [Novosphingobium sp. MW5]|nr:hypothetical protein [Novosphingobium sp. MW5]
MTGEWEDKFNEAPNMAYLGWGIYVTKRVSGDAKKRKAASVCRGTSGWKGHLAVDVRLSVRLSALSSIQLQLRRTGGRRHTIAPMSRKSTSAQTRTATTIRMCSHRTSDPRIFQYYSVAEDELAKGFAGQYQSAQETADAIAAAWEKGITDQIGRESQLKLYRASLGL